MLEFGYYFALTLPLAVAVWALVEWRQGKKRAIRCPHPRLKRVYVRHDGRNIPTDEVQCAQCKQRMKA